MRRRLAILPMALLALVPVVSGPLTQHPSATAIDGRLAALQEESIDLQHKLLDAREGFAAERGEALAFANDAAGELVDLELERLSLEDAVEAARLATDVAESRAKDRAADVRRIDASQRQIAEYVGVLLSELPYGPTLAPRLTACNDCLDAGRSGDAELVLAELVDGLDRRAQQVAVGNCNLRTANGESANVELLEIGLFAFAYRTAEDLAISFAAPRDANGFRWREGLPEQLAAQWAALFEAARGAREGTLGVPMDVSGSLGLDVPLLAPLLVDRFRAGGPVMWPLAAVAVLCLLLGLERAVALWWRTRPNADLGAGVARMLRNGDVAGATALAGSRDGPVARAVTAVLHALDVPRSAREDRLQEVLLREAPRLRRSLRAMAMLATIAPLLGLLGTITGIIETFGVLHSTGTNDPNAMAGGISEALLTTATGLVIAIPVLLWHGLLRGRADALLAAAEGQSVVVLNAADSVGVEARTTARAVRVAGQVQREGGAAPHAGAGE
ncbi:MAG: hypothetical protein GC161_04350 [Planctomycetaceae bacterium]|nr:hypothetical protein [Planctomycetaceae bacterium]